MIRILLSCCLIPLFTGCAISQQQKTSDLNQLYKNNQLYDAQHFVEQQLAAKKNPDAVWSLQAASLARLNNQPELSNQHFERIETILQTDSLESAVQNGVQNVTQVVVDQSATKYEPTYFEATFVNTYKALNYWQIQDIANARIEFNRLDERQRRSAAYYQSQISQQAAQLSEHQQASSAQSAITTLSSTKWQAYEGYVNPFSSYLHGLFFMTQGLDNSDFNKARTSFERAFALSEQNAFIADDLALLTQLANNEPQDENKRITWLIFENGLAPKRGEERLDLPLDINNRFVYVGVSFPTLQPLPTAMDYLTLQSDDDFVIRSEPIADIERIIYSDFNLRLPSMVLKSIASAIVKTTATKIASDQLGALGLIVGSIYQFATNFTDTRSWSLLPNEFQLARLEHQNDYVIVSTPEGKRSKIHLPKQPYSIIYIKLINPNSTLNYNVF